MNRYCCVLLLLTAVGCGPQKDIGADYISRLENVLETNVSMQPAPFPAFPSARDLMLEATPDQLSIREFLSLRECRLHTVLARRNSLIGKLAEPSQLLFNDLDILNTGPPCVARLNDPVLAEKLNGFLTAKHATISQSLWRAVLAEDENRAFWSAAPGGNDYPRVMSTEIIPNLKALIQFTQQINNGEVAFSAAEYRALERHLGQLRFGDGGALLREYAELGHALEIANALIDARLKRPLCLRTRPTQAARYFQNVVVQVFIQQIQPHAVALNQREAQLMPRYRALETPLLAAATPAYRDWVSWRERILEQGKSAATRHALKVQQLFNQCGITPGNKIR